MRADGTILDLLPVGRIIAFTGALLIALFTLIKPEASTGLGAIGRLVFWSLHVGLGLGALWIAGRWLAYGDRLPSGTWPAVLVTGCAAILLAAPGYLLLDVLFIAHKVDIDPDPPAAWPMILVEEVFELAPWFMLAWILINLPVLLPKPTRSIDLDDSVSLDYETEFATRRAEANASPRALTSGDPRPEPDNQANLASKQSVAHRASLKLVSREQGDGSETNTQDLQAQNSQKQMFLQSLPGVVGTDVIAVSSDLHYLNVWTVAGRSTVLGNLRDVVNDLGDIGLQVHRSHWVAHAHVRRIIGSASNASCILSNELRIPISRRRWKSVREHYGRGVIHSSNAAGKKSAGE